MKKREKREKKEILELERVLRCYFRLGLDSRRLTFFQAADRIRGYAAGNARRERELVAIYELFRFLRATGRSELLDVLYYISGRTMPHTHPRYRAGERQSIVAYAIKSYCDERTVYRRIDLVAGLYFRLLTI